MRIRGVSLVAVLALALSACVSHDEQAQTAAAAMARGPSPRVECAPAAATIYFEPDAVRIRGVSMPLLQEVVGKINACKTAGGALDRIIVTAFADPAEANPAERERQADLRARTVTEALVLAGAPAQSIQTRRGSSEDAGVMQRRAEIVAQMW